MQTWQFHPDYADSEAVRAFQTLESVFELKGETVTTGLLGAASRVSVDGKTYYIKLYQRAGKGLRRWIGRSRLRGEWENLLRFEKWGIPAAPVIAFGLEKRGLFFKRGAIVTEELPDTDDLSQLAKENDPRLKDRQWVMYSSTQLARAARIMHSHGFAHGDLKWRNILATKGANSQIYLIDCPAGNFWIPPFLQYRKNKDLACLDKAAKEVLTRTQRLRFFLDYLKQEKLGQKSKKQLRRILTFFERQK